MDESFIAPLREIYTLCRETVPAGFGRRRRLPDVVRDSVGQSRACRSYVSLRGHSMPRYLQRMVEPNFQRGAFVEAEIAVCQESRYRADGCSDAGADGSTASAASHCTANCAH